MFNVMKNNILATPCPTAAHIKAAWLETRPKHPNADYPGMMRVTAYHEAGHLVAAHKLSEPWYMAAIRPFGMGLAGVRYKLTTNSLRESLQCAQDMHVIALGGRMAVRLFIENNHNFSPENHDDYCFTPAGCGGDFQIINSVLHEILKHHAAQNNAHGTAYPGNDILKHERTRAQSEGKRILIENEDLVHKAADYLLTNEIMFPRDMVRIAQSRTEPRRSSSPSRPYL